MLYRPHLANPERRPGFILLAVLIVVTVLTLAAYQYSEMMMAEYRAADSSRRMAQARALAESGIQYAAALLSNPDAMTNTLNGDPYDNASVFQGVLVQDSDNPRARGRFSIIAPLGPDDNPGSAQPYRFGVTDESGKINLNALMKLDSSGKVAHDTLMQLPNITEDVVNSILDWMDPDSDTRSEGAEEDYYTTQSPPYHCKNGPLDSIEELLLVKGMTPQLLFGNDFNRNGILDPEEDDGSGSRNLGLAAYLTVLSREQNIDSQGNPRINVNDSDLNTLATNLTNVLGQDLANYIIAYRMYGGSPVQQSSSGQGSRNRTGAAGAAGAGGGRGATLGRGTTTPNNAAPASNGAAGRGGRTTGGAGDNDADDQQAQPAQPARGPISRSSLNLSGRNARGGSRRIGSLYELINSQVTIPAANGQTGQGGPAGGRAGRGQAAQQSATSQQSQGTIYQSPLNDPSQLQQLLPLLLDETTTTSDPELPARVNVNTASQEVLTALPGMDSATVQAILDHRPDPSSGQAPDPIYQTPAWLITEANVAPKTLEGLEKYITARTQVYRVQAVGYFDGGGPSVRIEAVIDTNGGRPRILSRRELTQLGKGFDLSAAPQ